MATTCPTCGSKLADELSVMWCETCGKSFKRHDRPAPRGTSPEKALPPPPVAMSAPSAPTPAEANAPILPAVNDLSRPARIPRRPKRINPVAAGLATVVIGGVFVGSLLLSFASTMSPPEKEPTPPEPPLREIPNSELVETSASDLWAAYDRNGVRADQNSKGKLSIVSGNVHSIDNDALGNPYVLLETGHLGKVQCVFTDPDELIHVVRGQFLKVRGTCTGKAVLNIMFVDCRSVRTRRRW